MSQIGDILLATFQAIITIFVVYIAGFILVKLKKVDQLGISAMSQATNCLFLPSLAVTTLGAGLSVEVLKYAYPLTVAGTGITAYYFFIAKWLLVPLAKPTKSFERWFILGQVIVSYIALPLIMVETLCSKVKFQKSDFYLTDLEKELEINNSQAFYFGEDECKSTGELYIFLYNFVISLLLFSVGWNYAAVQPEETIELTDDTASISGEEVKDEEKAEKSDNLRKNEDERPFWRRMLYTGVEMFIYRPVPLARLTGIFIGLVEPIQNLFFNESGDAPLDSIAAGFQVLSQATTPIINVVMACTLAVKLLSLPKWSYMFGNEAELGVSRQSVIVFAVGRMIIIPGITFAWLYFVVEATFPEDKLMKFIVFIELFVPTGNMVVVLAQILEQRHNAEALAVSMLLQYVIGVFSISLWTFLLMYVLELEF